MSKRDDRTAIDCIVRHNDTELLSRFGFDDAAIEEFNADQIFGKRLIDLLSLTVRDGRVVTSWGTKTAVGLGATVRRILNEVE